MATAVVQTSIWQFDVASSLATWTGLTTGDNGDAVPGCGFADRSVQVDGTFGAATVTFQGSNDGVNWFTLTDPGGNNLSFTSAGLKQVLQVALFMRPSVASGTGVSVNVRLLMTRNK